MPSLPIFFLEQIADEYQLSEFEKDSFVARFSDMERTDIVVAQEINISRDRYSSRMTRVYEKFGITENGRSKSYILFLKLLDLYQIRQPDPFNHVTEEALNYVVEEANTKLEPLVQSTCKSIRVLDMDFPIDISDIYTEIKVLTRVVSRRFIKLSDFLENFNFNLYDSLSIGFSHTQTDQISGIDYVQEHQKIVILGKPGSGKTTFLKHISLLCSQRRNFDSYIPFFISIRTFAENQNGLRLLDYLVDTYKHHNLEREEIEKLLRNGRVFCLFDGLDEIREAQKKFVIEELQAFADNYSSNRFIITCRIAAQEYAFNGFFEIEIADFNDKQIEQFASNWFSSVNENIESGGEENLAQEFISRIEKENRIRELATNPLLLTLLCLVFKDSGGFPSNRAELYEEGLDILLKKWDARRNIERDQAYKKLSRQRKENLLSYIAYITFKDNRYFFKQKTVEKYIREYISNLPNASDDSGVLELDSRAILRSIEAQHGLLIERAKGIYSFSHLTFHEYFTARKIIGNFDPSSKEKEVAELVSNTSDPRWREIFLLMIGMTTNADYFLIKTKEHVDSLLLNLNLDAFTDWLYEFFGSINPEIKNPANVRIFYFCLACVDLGLKAINPGDNRDLQADHDLIFSLNLARAIHTNLEQLSSLTNVSFSNESFIQVRESCSLLQQTLEKVLNHVSDPKFSSILTEHVRKLPSSDNRIRSWWNSDGEIWISHLRNLLIQHRKIGHGWEFSFEQAIQIKQYYEASKLLYDCLMADCYVSREVRQSILEGLLLPTHNVSRS